MKRTIYYGGDILTMREDFYTQAVLVADGVIRRIGRKEEVLAERMPGTELVDLEGRAMLPGFVDSHSHITAVAETAGLLSLNGVGNFDQLCGRIRQYKREHKIGDGEWIVGVGYDHNLLEERRHPDKAVLDRAAPENPVLISHASGHMGVMNSAALRAGGISRDTPDPDGGLIGRGEDGDPNGYLEEAAFINRSSAAAAPQDDGRKLKNLALAQESYLKHGVTTVQDGLTRKAQWELLKRAAERGGLAVDVVSYPDLRQDGERIARENPAFCGKYRNRLKIGGYKILLDGSPQGRTAWMLDPYPGAKDGYRGYPAHTDAEVGDFARVASEQGMQLLAHCNGDAAAEQFIRACEAVPLSRPVMIHGQLVRPEQLARMARLSMAASFFVAHVWHWGDVHIENFGLERAGRISPVRSALDGGTPCTLHQDSPVIEPDMLETVWAAVNRRTRAGVLLGGEERISVIEALRAVTRTGAWQYFEEGQKGRIAPGFCADFVILDQNPLAVQAEKLRDLRVLRTIKAGEVLYSAE